MTDRIKKLVSFLDKCKTFADIGCDHGYCTLYMLENGLCESAFISDISAPSLKKAEELLKDYIAAGKVKSVCCAGLEMTDSDTEEVLIAGMGGEEITEILINSFIPEKFVFQPMKNAEKLRTFLLDSDAYIMRDEVFESGNKFYTVIKGVRKSTVKQAYSRANLLFGLDLSSPAAKKYIQSELNKKLSYLRRNLGDFDRKKISAEAAFYEGVLNGEIK